MTTDTLTDLASQLETVAARLRSGELDGDDAAALVDECARIAARTGAELESRAREQIAPGQEPLLSRQEHLL